MPHSQRHNVRASFPARGPSLGLSMWQQLSDGFFHLRRLIAGESLPDQKPTTPRPLPPPSLAFLHDFHHHLSWITPARVPGKERGRLPDFPSNVLCSLMLFPFPRRVILCPLCNHPFRRDKCHPGQQQHAPGLELGPSGQVRFCASFFSVDRSARPFPLSWNGLF